MMNLLCCKHGPFAKGIIFGSVVTFAQIISVKIRHACYMRSLSDDRSFFKSPRNLNGIMNKILSNFLNRKYSF